MASFVVIGLAKTISF